MPSRVYLNGTYVDKLDARLSVYDHGLLYGDGVWEGMRLFHGEVFRLDEHLKLLTEAAAALLLPLPWSTKELADTVRAAVAANVRQFGYVRVIITRGAGTIGLDPRKCDPQLIILVDDVVPFPAELSSHGLHAITASKVQLDPANPLHRVRSLSHAHMTIAKAEALRAGCLEAVLKTTNDKVAGGTEGHIFVVKNAAIRTPSSNESVPVDVWRDVVREAAGVPFTEASVSFAELTTADELFLAGTTGGVIAIVQLDGQTIGSGCEGPITRTLRTTIRERTHGTSAG
jgi:branched-chain amino acid aminotransferase